MMNEKDFYKNTIKVIDFLMDNSDGCRQYIRCDKCPMCHGAEWDCLIIKVKEEAKKRLKQEEDKKIKSFGGGGSIGGAMIRAMIEAAEK